MTVALRSLRVTADMDGRQYAAGAKQVDAANSSMAASSLQAAHALAQADRQAGQSGGVLASLQRQFVASYRAADDFEKAIARLGRGIEKGAVPLDRVETILDGIYRKYGLTANAAGLLENGQVALGNAALALNAKLEQQEGQLDQVALAHKRMANAANDNAFRQRVLMFQLNDVFQSIALGMPLTQVLLQQGPQIAQIYGPGEGGIGRAFRESAKMITGMLTKFPLVTAGAVTIGAAFAALTWEINKTTDVSVGFGDAALASLQVLGNYIWDELEPAVSAISPWFQAAWDGVIAGVKWLGNGIIATIKSAIDVVKFNVGSLPGAFTVAGEAAANGFIKAFEWMINKAIAGLNKLISFSNEMMETFGLSYVTDKLGWTTNGKVKPFDPFEAGTADFGGSSARADMDRRQKDLFRTVGANYDQDYLGSYFKDIRDQAIKNATDDDKKKGGRGERESDYERTIRRIREQTAATQEDTRVIDLSTYARERQAAVQDILTAAQRDGLDVGKAFANAQELINARTDSLSPALVEQRQRILDVASAYAQAKADAEKAEEAQRTLQEALNVGRDVFGGMIDGFIEGKKAADVLVDSLKRIGSALVDNVLDSIFKVQNAGSSGGILDWFGSLFGGGGSTFQANTTLGSFLTNGYAKGGVFDQGINGFSNQVVSRPTYFAFAKGAGLMGEAGPEAIMPLRRDAAGRLGISAAGNGVQASNIVLNFAPVINAAKGDTAEVAELRQEFYRMKASFKGEVVKTVQEAQKRRGL